MKKNKKKYEIIVDSCGFRTVKNLPTEKELAKFYNNFMRNAKTRPKNYQVNYNVKERQHIELLNELRFFSILKARPMWKENNVSLLEVGVGEGFTIAHAKSKGWNVTGIDYSSDGIKKFNPKILKNIKIGNAFKILEKMKKQKQKFDICMINNVLEHVIDPQKVLDDLRLLLTDNGIISISIPNDFSDIQLEALKLGNIDKEFWVDPPEHLHYFNTKNILGFMKKQNFKIIDMFSSFPLDFFLYHPGSNYIKNEKTGKAVHHARVELDLIMAKSGLKNYHKLSQSFASCSVGRNFTILVTPKK
jgi:2-polyprenyl-3-methyl-5-hydroxy-6-metoxy-1,4-benzoquinol methylase